MCHLTIPSADIHHRQVKFVLNLYLLLGRLTGLVRRPRGRGLCGAHERPLLDPLHGTYPATRCGCAALGLVQDHWNLSD